MFDEMNNENTTEQSTQSTASTASTSPAQPADALNDKIAKNLADIFLTLQLVYKLPRKYQDQLLRDSYKALEILYHEQLVTAMKDGAATLPSLMAEDLENMTAEEKENVLYRRQTDFLSFLKLMKMSDVIERR